MGEVSEEVPAEVTGLGNGNVLHTCIKKKVVIFQRCEQSDKIELKQLSEE